MPEEESKESVPALVEEAGNGGKAQRMLEEVVDADPGVALATRILGGEVVAVRANGEGT